MSSTSDVQEIIEVDDDDDSTTFSDYFDLIERYDDDLSNKSRTLSSSPISSDFEDGTISGSEIYDSSDEGMERSPRADLNRYVEGETLSKFESLPSELIQQIASYAWSDEDVINLSLASPIIAMHIAADNSDVWRRRFLSLYDAPFIESPYEFAIAYKLRRLVLRKFEHFGLISKRKSRIQLEVIRDMVLEAYNPPKSHLTPPKHSKNLAALASCSTSVWTLELATSLLHQNGYVKYGRPNPLFDALQVLLSHLVLSRKSGLAWHAAAGRDDYDLARVYHFNKPLQPILIFRLNEIEECGFRSTRFPNLRKSETLASSVHFEVDTHGLLHIRNFWQRHLIDSTLTTSEHTYSSMSKALETQGLNPRKWDRPLQAKLPVNTEWYGHYSSLRPWPKTRDDIEDQQSCAEDWERIDPMVLSFETSHENEDDSFWPPLFSTIPLFEEILLPDELASMSNQIYIRGISSFLLLGKAEEVSELPQWHPFKGLRLHGVVHDVPAQITFGDKDAQEKAAENGDIPIPGWKHIAMIMYKPSSRTLLSVLEHAEEDYGGPTNVEFNTAEIWNNQNVEVGMTEQVSSVPTPSSDSETTITSGTDVTLDSEDSNVAQVERELKRLLEARITSFTNTYTELLAAQSRETDENENDNPYIPSYAKKSRNTTAKPLPPIWSPAHISQLDDTFSPAKHMTWDDGTIDFAYAYEGIIIPGGKIMMGRFWRMHGDDGMGPGKEVGSDGIGVEVRPVQRPISKDTNGDTDCFRNGDEASSENGTEGKQEIHIEPRKLRRRRKLIDSDEDTDDDYVDPGDEDAGQAVAEEPPIEEQEFEFVTIVNGEETRALNGHKGLDRGPFVFWAG